MKSLSTKLFYAIVCASMLVTLLGTQSAYAANFSVATAADLITAINTANANNADDVITLTANIILNAADNPSNGLPIIGTDSGHSLTIEGGGHTISRNGAAPDFRILQIGTNANVTINDLTLTGGNNVPGAGILMQTGSNLIVDNVEVSGNTANNNRGGGIYNYYATLTIQNGSVIGKSGAPNTACTGGGVFTEGLSSAVTTIIDASTISYNQSPICAGGGLYVLNNAQLTVRNGSVISNNTGGDPFPTPDHTGGGGIYGTASPTITISDSIVSNNTVNCAGTTGCGGGGLKGANSVTITNSTFSNNTVNCNASSNCGGAGAYNTATMNISDSTFSNNASVRNGSSTLGGGIYNNNVLTINTSTLSNNTSDYGGGISNYNGTLNMGNSTMSGNSATIYGGGLYNDFGKATITNSTFSGNSANTEGGGIFTGAGCFTDKAQVLMADGSTKNIAEIVAGDEVLSYDFTTGQQVVSTVTHVMSRLAPEFLLINGLEVTSEHPFAIGEDEWRKAGELQIGDRILSNTGWTTINSISAVQEQVTVYNITVDKTHNYYVSDGKDRYLVHNKQAAANAGEVMLNNSIITNTTAGGDCINYAGSFTGNNNLIDDYAAGACSGISSAAVTNFNATLANNGGPTQTHALQFGSNAVDTGTASLCSNAPINNLDQRGATRPAACDIGAYERDTVGPEVISTSLLSSYSVSGPSTFTITFNVNLNNVGGGAGAHDAENPANYMIVEEGSTTGFQTLACDTTDLINDTHYTIDNVTYTQNGYTSTLNINSGTALPIGSYRLFVCGTTSIRTPANQILNGGDFDYTFDFVVGQTTASALPDTGFAPNRITSLPAQSNSYADLGNIWMEIPSLNVKTEIVGVPQSAEGWNVDWLGNSAGWLHGTAFPSWEGNSVVTAHVYDSNGLPGPFQKIKNLKSEDKVIVHMYGEKYIFEVRDSSMVFPSSTKSALEHLEGHSYLTLITCQWYNPVMDNYAFRRVVRAVLISVE